MAALSIDVIYIIIYSSVIHALKHYKAGFYLSALCTKAADIFAQNAI